MIRDEFNKQSTKKISVKESEGIRKLGERGYYSSKIPKLRDRIKIMNFSSWFVFVIGVLMTIMLVITFIVKKDDLDVSFYVYSLLTALMLLFWFLWMFVFKFSVKRKIEKYQQALKEVTEKDASKQQLAYNFLLKNQKEDKGE